MEPRASSAVADAAAAAAWGDKPDGVQITVFRELCENLCWGR